MLKFVYALISSESDYYAEQAALSMHSLRLHNSDAHITLITDDETLSSLTGGRALVKNYIDDCIIVNSPDGFSPKQRSRVIKTTLRQNIEGDFLFLDCDTIVMGSLKELDSFECDVAVVYAQHTNTSEYSLVDNHWDSEGQHWHMTKYYNAREVDPAGKAKIRCHCNSGVMLCRDTGNAHRLFEKWHEYWFESSTKYDWHSDQCDLWRADAVLGGILTELPGIYNCQMIYPKTALRYLFDCKILHYFSTSQYLFNLGFNRHEVLESVRHNGITAEIETIMQNLKRDYFNSFTLKMPASSDKKQPAAQPSLFRRVCSKVYRLIFTKCPR